MTREKTTKSTTTYRFGIPCPHCGGGLKTRTSRAESRLYRYLELQCLDADCAATFGAELSITHAIHDSRSPDPAIQLRKAPPRPREPTELKPANDDRRGPEVPPVPANDDDLTTAAAL